MNPRSVEFLLDYNDWWNDRGRYAHNLRGVPEAPAHTDVSEAIDWACEQIERMQSELANFATARPAEEWHEAIGDVLWWKFPIEEPPYCGTPLDSSWYASYHTHFTLIAVPLPPPPGETK